MLLPIAMTDAASRPNVVARLCQKKSSRHLRRSGIARRKRNAVLGCETDIPLGGKGKGMTSEVFTSTNANVGSSCICDLGTDAFFQLFFKTCIRPFCTLKALYQGSMRCLLALSGIKVR
jgi:hypothetical protein